jgi:hypothetical protein
MTRNGAPFHGAIGEGKTVSSAPSPQMPDAALAGESTVGKRNKAVATTANRLAKSILTTFLEGVRNRAALPAGPDRRIAELADISQQI